MAIDPSIISDGARMQQLIQQNNMNQLQELGGNLGRIVLGRRINQMRQLEKPEDQQAFANNSIFSPFLNDTLRADRAAAAKAAADQLKFDADLTKTYSDIGKTDSETLKNNQQAGGYGLDNAGKVGSAVQKAIGFGATTGNKQAIIDGLNLGKSTGEITPEAYQTAITALGNLNSIDDIKKFGLAMFDPKYSLTTADNVLDNNTSADNNIRSTNAQIYGIDKTAETADENRAVQVKRLEFDQQQAEIKNGQGEIKEANGKLWIVYKDGTARPAVDANGTQLAASNNQQNQAQNEETKRIKRVDTLLPEIEKLLKDPDATGSRTGNAIDTVAGWASVSTKGQQISASLGTLAGQLVALMPRMEGPQSNIDVDMYKEMAGRLGDPNIPVQTRMAALQTIRQLNEKYKQLNSQSSNQLQPGQIPSSDAGGRPPLSSFFN